MRVLVAAIIALLTLPGAAAAQHAAPSIVDELAQDPTWLKLGRYKRSVTGRARWRSDVVTPDYFLADQGRVDPRAELVATIAALSLPVGANPNTHALCRFPGRALWLSRALEWPLPNALDVCPDYRAWARDGRVTGVSVILVSGYLSNPGSVYGHLLVRFHSVGDGRERSDLLETSMNYGAAASEDDALVPYVIKGLFGGYRSKFTTLEYFHHEERYREDQLRDVWEYNLRLSQSEVDLLVAHGWEMMGSENNYYFLRQNCAYRIAELIGVVVDRAADAKHQALDDAGRCVPHPGGRRSERRTAGGRGSPAGVAADGVSRGIPGASKRCAPACDRLHHG